MSRSSRALKLSIFAPIALTGLFSCASNKTYTEAVYAFGTTWSINLYEGNEQVLHDVVSYIHETSLLFDANPTNVAGVYALNKNGYLDHPDSRLIEAINLGQRVESESDGAYCLCLGELTSTWLNALDKDEVPEAGIIDELLEEAKATTLTLTQDRLVKTGNGKLDLGSLGKGFALRGVKAILEKNDITKYFINAGTSSLLLGENSSPSGSVKVILEDAKDRYFVAKNQSVSVTAVSRQLYEVGGKRYSHVIDARNGSAEVVYDALCLAGDDPALLDAYSTAFFFAGESKLKQLETVGIKAALMKGGSVVYETPSFLD